MMTSFPYLELGVKGDALSNPREVYVQSQPSRRNLTHTFDKVCTQIRDRVCSSHHPKTLSIPSSKVFMARLTKGSYKRKLVHPYVIPSSPDPMHSTSAHNISARNVRIHEQHHPLTC
jgi:hypothetical protein